MDSPLGLTLANVFNCFYERKWLKKCPLEFKPVFYIRHVDYIFVLLKSKHCLKKFHKYFNTCFQNMSFSFEKEKTAKMTFLDVKISRKNGKFVITFYHKTPFSVVCIHFKSFLSFTHEFSMFYTLVCRCLTLCSDWTKFCRDLVTLKEIFQRKDYPTSFLDKCLK